MAKTSSAHLSDAQKAARAYSVQVTHLLKLNQTAHKVVLQQYRQIQAERFVVEHAPSRVVKEKRQK